MVDVPLSRTPAEVYPLTLFHDKKAQERKMLEKISFGLRAIYTTAVVRKYIVFGVKLTSLK